MNDRDLWAAVVAEFIGPFTLVTAGVGAIISTQNLGDGGNLVAISLAHGLAIGLRLPPWITFPVVTSIRP